MKAIFVLAALIVAVSCSPCSELENFEKVGLRGDFSGCDDVIFSSSNMREDFQYCKRAFSMCACKTFAGDATATPAKKRNNPYRHIQSCDSGDFGANALFDELIARAASMKTERDELEKERMEKIREKEKENWENIRKEAVEEQAKRREDSIRGMTPSLIGSPDYEGPKKREPEIARDCHTIKNELVTALDIWKSLEEDRAAKIAASEQRSQAEAAIEAAQASLKAAQASLEDANQALEKIGKSVEDSQKAYDDMDFDGLQTEAQENKCEGYDEESIKLYKCYKNDKRGNSEGVDTNGNDAMFTDTDPFKSCEDFRANGALPGSERDDGTWENRSMYRNEVLSCICATCGGEVVKERGHRSRCNF